MSQQSRKKRTVTQRKKREIAPRVWVISAASVAVICVAVILIARFASGGGGPGVNSQKSNPSVVATVNGVPIAYGEFMLSISAVKGGVLSSIIARGGDQGSPDFWDTPVNGEAPIVTLKKAALDNAVKKKVIQILGAEKGLVGDISYGAMESDMETENKRREDALAKKQPIYGPQQYSEQVFYDLQIADLEYQIQQEIQRTTTFPEQEMQRIFQEKWANTPTTAGWINIKKLFAAYEYEDLLSVEKAKMLMDGVYMRLQSGLDFDSAADEMESVELVEQTLSLRRGMGDTSQRASITAAEFLSEGEISGVYEDMGGYSILRVEERSPVEYNSYENMKEVIANDLAIAEYDRIVQGLVAVADVRTTEVYDGIDQVIITGRQ